MQRDGVFRSRHPLRPGLGLDWTLLFSPSDRGLSIHLLSRPRVGYRLVPLSFHALSHIRTPAPAPSLTPESPGRVSLLGQPLTRGHGCHTRSSKPAQFRGPI